ncbi:hypothetical protein ACIG87_29260 [Micromonospora sp. NPDC051925]|uniref:hypothetical protein n=1 Tax=Micromonospora sp. NPDC051925 TaxID=3364288 RepID=UPI0037C61CAD
MVAGEDVEGQGLVVGDLWHADIAEPLAGGAFDVSQERKLSLADHTDAHRVIVPGAGGR